MEGGLASSGVCCVRCGDDIPMGRIKAVPNTKVCVQCSTTSAYSGRIVSYGTNADNAQQEFEIIKDPKIAQQLKELEKQTLEKI